MLLIERAGLSHAAKERKHLRGVARISRAVSCTELCFPRQASIQAAGCTLHRKKGNESLFHTLKTTIKYFKTYAKQTRLAIADRKLKKDSKNLDQTGIQNRYKFQRSCADFSSARHFTFAAVKKPGPLQRQLKGRLMFHTHHVLTVLWRRNYVRTFNSIGSKRFRALWRPGNSK